MANEVRGGGGSFPLDQSRYVSGSPEPATNSPKVSEMRDTAGKSHRVSSGGGGSGLAIIIGALVVALLCKAIGAK